MGTTDTLRFRHNQAIWVAAVLAFLGALPLATSRWFLLPLLLVPVAVGVWAWRAGTDADPAGVRVRALLGQRRIAWSEIVELASDPRGQAVVRLRDGRTTTLPAVRAADLPDLVAASGQPLAGTAETRERPDPAGQ
ncbi:PH domain-containing protein [Plantactinospora sp. WMMB334]|uniref:PH domain-containing protein n=1 Tax=Plantactinospora sp. WMMB334 TaxID=3404119 RepID=UPI003B948E84